MEPFNVETFGSTRSENLNTANNVSATQMTWQETHPIQKQHPRLTFINTSAQDNYSFH